MKMRMLLQKLFATITVCYHSTYYLNRIIIVYFSMLFREPETITLSDIVELKETWVDRCWACLEGLVKCITCSRRPIRSMEIFKNTACVFNQVDMWSRLLFPLSFVMINFLYWFAFIYYSSNGGT